MNHKMRIIFMGTPDFAVASLKALVETGQHIVAVITAPDRPAGRGMHLTPSPVKQYATSQGLNIMQPERLKDEQFIESLKALNPDLGIVVAFRMLPEIVWRLPRLGTINLHASLLPQYRGAAPIHWAIINGETETGVTTFFLQHEIDTGEIILQKRTPIAENETTGSLYDRLMHLGAALVVETVKQIEIGTLHTTPQVVSQNLKPAPKIFKEMCRVDWNKKGPDIVNFVRGLQPSPGAFTVADGKVIKLHRVQFRACQHNLTIKQIVCVDQHIQIAVTDGFIEWMDIQPEGKKRMTSGEYLLGNTIKHLE